MNFSWPLIPVLGGYWFVTHWNRTRFITKRRSGYHLFFWAAIAGMFLHIPGTAVAVVVDRVVVDRVIIDSCLFYYPPPFCFDKWSLFTLNMYPHIAICSFLSGFALPVVVNPFSSKQKATDNAAADNGDLLEVLLTEAISRTVPVALVLKSRKVHIGFALNNGIEALDGEFDIALLPLVSGYQDPDTLDLKLTTYYPPSQVQVREALASAERSPRRRLQVGIHWSVIIPLSTIVSARIFDPDADPPRDNRIG